MFRIALEISQQVKNTLCIYRITTNTLMKTNCIVQCTCSINGKKIMVCFAASCILHGNRADVKGVLYPGTGQDILSTEHARTGQIMNINDKHS